MEDDQWHELKKHLGKVAKSLTLLAIADSVLVI
jgi:hypothetical protein